MIKIVQVIEIDGKKYVPLEDYQQLLGELEKRTKCWENTADAVAEIIANGGEDEVYNG